MPVWPRTLKAIFFAIRSAYGTFILQNTGFSKWAMLDSNQRLPPCKGGKGYCRGLPRVAKPAYLSRFLFYALLRVAGYCARGGVREDE